jgi:predicted amidohydrolase
MKTTLIQAPLVWENAAENLAYFQYKIATLTEETDLIVLPEMFATGFSMNPKNIAETMNGKSVSWMQKTAQTKNCAITGSLIIAENGHFYNRLLFVYPSGEIVFYDKKHLFSLAGEDKIYTAGNNKLIIAYKNFKICLMICYDLRFPVFTRNTTDYDLLIFVANWPDTRINAWDTLLKARAIENMCYTIGVNRIGTDNSKLNYIGHSQAIDYLGNYLIKPQTTEGVFNCQLDKEKMLKVREKLGFLNDKDAFELKL